MMLATPKAPYVVTTGANSLFTEHRWHTASELSLGAFWKFRNLYHTMIAIASKATIVD